MEVEKKEIENEILNPNANNASQNCDIPMKIVNKNIDIFFVILFAQVLAVL